MQRRVGKGESFECFCDSGIGFGSMVFWEEMMVCLGISKVYNTWCGLFNLRNELELTVCECDKLV